MPQKQLHRAQNGDDDTCWYVPAYSATGDMNGLVSLRAWLSTRWRNKSELTMHVIFSNLD